jgi:hypothetical protein
VKVRWLQTLLRRTVFAGDTTRFGVLATSILVHCTVP